MGILIIFVDGSVVHWICPVFAPLHRRCIEILPHV